MHFDLQIRNYFNLSTLNKDLCFPIIMNMLTVLLYAHGIKALALSFFGKVIISFLKNFTNCNVKL